MALKMILIYLQILFSVLLIILILLQTQGTGLSLTFGGSSSFYRSKRGIEKLFFYATIVLGILFVGNALTIFLI